MEEPEVVPLVIYTGKNKRVVIGTATINPDGTMVATVTSQLFIEHLSQDLEVSTPPFSIYRFVQELAMADEAGESLGSRTQRPHHPDGWFPDRPAEQESNEKPPPRGTLRSGVHDRPKKD